MRPIHAYNYSPHTKKKEKGEIQFDDWVDIFRALGNRYRLKIFLAVSKNPGITLDQINQIVGGEFRNISAHTKKLMHTGLIEKGYKGTYVQHQLTPLGKKVAKIVKRLF